MTRAKFIAQPHADFRIGNFLKEAFADPRWTEFRAAVAFVKRSGTKHIRDLLEAFSKRGTVNVSAGVDGGGTSAEGLRELIDAVAERGTLYVFHNASSSTFHPKIFMFRNADASEVVVGSGNLTEGGLFTNYEASVRLSLDLGVPADADIHNSIAGALELWSTPKEGLCYSLDLALWQRLRDENYLPDEAKAWGDEKIAAEDAKTRTPDLFARTGVPAAPRTQRPPENPPPELADEPTEMEDDEGLEIPNPAPVPAQAGHYRIFLMTLQKTDVGVGQTTKGTARRSPEIFIPLVARNYDPAFWGWPNLFVEDPKWNGPKDRDGRGKMDRPDVMFRLGGAIFPVHMWYNPDKRDLRLRNEHVRSAGSIGDILYVERSDGVGGFAYYADVVPQGSPRHAELLVQCTNPVRNSKKLFGYL